MYIFKFLHRLYQLFFYFYLIIFNTINFNYLQKKLMQVVDWFKIGALVRREISLCARLENA